MANTPSHKLFWTFGEHQWLPSLSYSLFNGSQYEGRPMLPIVEDFD
jgi:hypothetical protein